jgi:hypothetical protein
VRDNMGHVEHRRDPESLRQSCWEERVYAFAARCTRQPRCGRLGKRGLPAQTSAVGQFPIARTYQPLLILSLLDPGC